MDNCIRAAARIIEGADGLPFLRYMSGIYHHEGNGVVGRVSKLAAEIGMIRGTGQDIALTDAGFLVSNVAKEYCHYVDQGRTTASPKPAPEIIAGKDVLDLGCSFGRSLWEFQRSAHSAIGLEPQEEFIELGRALSLQEGIVPPRIINGTAEDLDHYFTPNSFDFIFTRLVLNYVRVKPVLEKMVTALRPGGKVWISVDSPSDLFARFWKPGARPGWLLLALLNMPICILTGRQISVASHGRMLERHNPAYLPLWWWRKALRRHGFKNFEVFPSNALAFCAQK